MPGLIRFAAICSFAGAITTLLLLFLPSVPTDSFESSVELYKNELYMSKLWILFFHPQFNFLASLGIAIVLFRRYPLQISLGLVFLAVWAYTEMSQQALLIDGLNQIWRPGYVETSNESMKNAYHTLIHGARGLSDSHYFLVIYGFGIGSLLYGWAFIREGRWMRWIGAALVFIGLLSLTSFVRYYLAIDELSPVVNRIYQWIYPYLQPVVRIALGIWLWNSAARWSLPVKAELPH